MNKLIKMAVIAVGVGCVFGFTGCGVGNTPEAVAVESLKMFAQAVGAKGFTFKVVKSEINGDKGTVFVDRIDEKGKKEGTSDIPVRKVDGKWEVVQN